MDDYSDELLDELPDLDPDNRTRLELAQSSGFRFSGSIQANNSLMLFVKKRAKPGSKEFVDVTTLAPVTAPQCDSRGVKVANEVFNPQGEREREGERANGILLVMFVGVLERHLFLNSRKKKKKSGWQLPSLPDQLAVSNIHLEGEREEWRGRGLYVCVHKTNKCIPRHF